MGSHKLEMANWRGTARLTLYNPCFPTVPHHAASCRHAPDSICRARTDGESDVRLLITSLAASLPFLPLPLLSLSTWLYGQKI